MALLPREHKDAVVDQTSTTGTGTITFDLVPGTGGRTAAAHTSGVSVGYRIESSTGAIWENGTGVVTNTAGTWTMTRPAANVTAGSSGAGTNVTLSGTCTVMTGPLAADMEDVKPTGALTSGTRLTLTASSAKVQRRAFTGLGQGYALPDATTLQAGRTFDLHNDSPFMQPITDNGGTLRGFIPPFRAVRCSLVDNTTAAGVWGYEGRSFLGITASFFSTAITNGGQLFAVPLDSTRTLLLICGTDTYAVVYDSSSATWGTLVTVRTATNSNFFAAIKCATDKVLVVTLDASTSTAMESVTLSVSTVTITVNTANKGTATIAGAVTGINRYQFVQLAAGSYVLGYRRDTTTHALRAITVSTNTPTIGAEVTMTTSYGAMEPQVFAVSSTVVLAFGISSSGGSGYAKPYSLSGSTLTAGTAQTFGTAIVNGTLLRTLAWGTRWLVLWNENSTTVDAALISVSAGNASISSVTSVITSTGGLGMGSADAIVCNSKVVVGMGTSVGAQYARFNVLTDTAGTISKGTELVLDDDDGASAMAALFTVSNDAYFYSTSSVFAISASGASPSLTSIHRHRFGSLGSGGSTWAGYPSATYVQGGYREPANLYTSSASVVQIPYGISPLAQHVGAGGMSLETVHPGSAWNNAAQGNTTAEVWVIDSSANLSAQITRWEAGQT